MLKIKTNHPLNNMNYHTNYHSSYTLLFNRYQAMNDSVIIILNNTEVKEPFYFSITSQVFPRAGIVTVISIV